MMKLQVLVLLAGVFAIVLAQPQPPAQPEIKVATSSNSETIAHSRWGKQPVNPHKNVWLDWTLDSLKGPEPQKLKYASVVRLNVMQVNHQGMIRIHNPTKDKNSHYQLFDHHLGSYTSVLGPGQTHFVTVHEWGTLSLLL
ncbi:hypothetical protein PGT21_009287 [Puccinia graminis f. sp. tritici]|uniref:Uncharacterized protein n=1 Tax=Puccinia graminis f. sp. tritici TaxID=56615 RepID=A0A5B0PX62_PUCGR|nr:hypothetical protein PGTUg99_031527 [Puccinia graminis f. sp. tritici]KAA1105505.1 hypothetical protein PGT21_009287 [Puccinia graminis f. sp. tritici]